jgi:transcriptional regulator with XRE-family HTH domain
MAVELMRSFREQARGRTAHDPTDITVGRNIRIHRRNKGLTQTSVASRIGVSFQQLQKYEQGMNRVGGGRLFRIAEVLELPISALFEEGPLIRDEAGNSALELLAQRHALRLLRSFAQIDDLEMRQAVLQVVERFVSLRRSPQGSSN